MLFLVDDRVRIIGDRSRAVGIVLRVGNTNGVYYISDGTRQRMVLDDEIEQE